MIEAPQVHPCLPLRPRQEEGDPGALGAARPGPPAPLASAPAPQPLSRPSPPAPAPTTLSSRRPPPARTRPPPRPHSPLVVGFHPDLVGAVPAESAPSATRSRHGAVAAAVPLCRHPPLPAAGGPARGGGRATGPGGGGGGRAAAAVPRARRGPAPSSRRQPRAGGTTPSERGVSTGMGRGARSRAAGDHGRCPTGRRRRSGSSRSPAVPPGEGGRHASSVCVCSPPARYVDSSPHTPAERNAPRRGGRGEAAGRKGG